MWRAKQKLFPFRELAWDPASEVTKHRTHYVLLVEIVTSLYLLSQGGVSVILYKEHMGRLYVSRSMRET